MHREPTEKIFQIFQTRQTGLTPAEALRRLEKYGPNELAVKKSTPLIFQFFAEFKDILVIILLAAVIIAFATGDTKDALVILFIVILNAAIGFIQKYKAEKAIEALQKLISPKARVLRERIEMEIPAKYLVPGDILLLPEGSHINADARLIEEYELTVSEAVLTGESTPVKKHTNPVNKEHLNLAEHENMVFMGTLIANGNGKGVVINTGGSTMFGKIAHLTTTTQKDKSPLEKELYHLGIFVGKITIAISAVLFMLGYFWQGKPLAETFLFAIAVAVAAVPEGLPATITVALALGVQRLAKKNAISKQLSSVETLGATTVICSDKTGTLTKNEMTVREMYLNDFLAEVSGSGYNPNDGDLRIKKTDIHVSRKTKPENPIHDFNILQKQSPDIASSLELITRIATLCNNAKSPLQNIVSSRNLHTSSENGELATKSYQKKIRQGAMSRLQPKCANCSRKEVLQRAPKYDDHWNPLGDPTEAALLTVSMKTGFDPENIAAQYRRISELPFDSKRKMMTTIHKTPEKTIMAYTKGAPDQLLKHCTHIYHQGKSIPISPEMQEKILQENERMAGLALRVMGFAYREVAPIAKKIYQKEEVEKNLTFVGLMGMLDPPRNTVKEAVALAKKAGIKVYIVTGDFGLTAKAIAQEIGLIKNDVRIITGVELENLDSEDLKKLFQEKNDIIFARVSPEHKLKIVNALKEMDEIVAVTGDGVNDAPALKRADIGIAMGITGCDVSKEAANMVLADDSFSTIVVAIAEGRTIYQNLKKFIFYIFSCNIGELVTVFTAIALGMPSPLTAILILAVNLGTDVLPAIALSLEPSEKDVMETPPRRPTDHILKKKNIIHFSLHGLIMGGVALAVFFFALFRGGWTFGANLSQENDLYLKASTMTFALLVCIQMVNALNCRSSKNSIFKIGFFRNKHLLGAITLSLLTLIIFVEVPWLQTFIHTTHLSLFEWLTVTIASFSILLIEEIRKTLSLRALRRSP